MALIGQGATPVPIDYSNWARMTAQSSQATAAAVGNVLGKFEDMAEQRKKDKETIKAAEAKGKAVKELFGDQGGFLDSFLAGIGDEELPISERAAMAGGMNDLIAAGIDKFNTDRAVNMEERRLKMAEDVSTFNLGQAKTTAERENKAIAQSEQTEAFMAPQVLNQVLQQTVAAERSGSPVLIPSRQLQEALNAAAPGQQLSIAQAAMAGLPKQSAGQLMEVPITIDGQPGKGMARYNEQTGRFTLVPVDAVEAWGDGSGGQSIADPDKFSQSLPAPLAPYGEAFIKAGEKYGVDPKFLAAISIHETAGGTSNAFRNKRNAMGISDAKGPTMQKSVEDSIDAMARSLTRKGGHYEGASTIPQIGSIYAPRGAGNDPRGQNQYWPGKVAEYYAELGGNPQGSVMVQAGASTARQPAPQTETQKKIDEANLARIEGETAAKKQESEIAKSKDADIKTAALNNARETLTLIEDIEKHPGFGEAVGASFYSFLAGIPGVPDELDTPPGTDKAGAVSRINQLKSKTFLESAAKLRGMGALSDSEGKKLESAAANLDRAQTEKDFKAALKTYREVVLSNIADIEKRSGKATPAQDAPQSAQDRLRSRVFGQ